MFKVYNQETVKRNNRAYIKDVIYSNGPISRTEIAALTGLTPPTVTIVVADLLRLGLLRETSKSAATASGAAPGGRKRILVEFNPDAAYFVGLDIGPYHTFLSMMDLCGRVVYEKVYPRASYAYDEILEACTGYVEQFVYESGIGRNQVRTLAIGIANVVDVEAGTLRMDIKGGWGEYRLRDDFERKTGFRCIVDNNARCRAKTVYILGDKDLPDTFAYLFVARGISLPIIINGDCFFGKHYCAGKISHVKMAVCGVPEVCPSCGKTGCLEAYSSEYAIIRDCVRLKSPVLARIAKDPEAPHIKEILEAFEEGDEEIEAIFRRSMTYLGVALANVLNITNPGTVFVDAFIFTNTRIRKMFEDAVIENCYLTKPDELDIRYLDYNPYRTAEGACGGAIRNFILSCDE